MKRSGLWLAVLFLTTATSAFAQRSITPIRANVSALQRIAATAEKDYKASHARALALAQQNGWVIEKTYSNGTHVALQRLNAKGLPVYYITYNNTLSAVTTRTDQLWAGGALGLNLSGTGPAVANKMAIWDGGRVRATHQELVGRVDLKDDASEISDHATHVAGTMIASGVNPVSKGMAYAFKDLQAYDFNGDVAEMAEAAKNLLISNHSYGTIAGWHYNPDRKGTDEDPYWEWWGDADISATEDYNFGYYNSDAAEWDKIAFNAPYYLIVKSVGNTRGETGPGVGEPYYQRNSNGKFTLVKSRPENMSSNDSYDGVSTYGTAKNILAVGATSAIPEGYTQPSDVAPSDFSSYGPTDDGRIKPDVVGDGVSVLSSSGSSDRAYEIMSGTSMAAPNVSGSLLLLQEHYANLHDGDVMRAATLKGLAIHTASEAGENAGPDYNYGWGLLNAAAAAKMLTNANGTHVIEENTLAQDKTYTMQVIASGAGPLVVTISWTDPEAIAITDGADALNNRTARLVNDLDVRVNKGTTVYQPWTLDPENPGAAAMPGDNKLDNVEQVYLGNAVPGETYTITVKHKGTLKKGPQAYSLLVSGVGGTAFCASSATTGNGSINKVTIGSKTVIIPADNAAYRNLTSNVFGFEPGQSKVIAVELGGSNTPEVIKAFIDWNGDGDFNDAGELEAVSEALTGTTTFRASLTAPLGLLPGNRVRMRLVAQETTDATAVDACGSYARGETQDYLLQFEEPRKDIGVISVLPMGASLCASASQAVAVTLKNFGTATQSNIPVTVNVRRNGTQVTQLTGTYQGSLAPNKRAEFVLDGSFATEAGATYEVVALSGLQEDAVEENNRSARSFTISEAVAAPQAEVFRCGNESSYTLTGSGDGTIFWFSSPTADMPFAAGNQLRVSGNYSGTSMFASLNDFSATIGPATKDAFADGGYNQFSPDVIISTNAPMQLESARLYIGHSGKIKFTVINADGVPVSSQTISVTATRTVPGAGVQPNDPNDKGEVYSLGLALPQAGVYNIAIAYEDSATIFRNNQGVSGYPFGVPNIIQITGNTATTTSQDYYYYFYDLKVSALGCKSERVEVPVEVGEPLSTPVITRQGLALNSGVAEGNQWFLDNKPIPGATGQLYTPTESGDYMVLVQKNGCMSDVSLAYTYVYKPGIEELSADLVVSPNPSQGRFRVEVETSQPEDILFEVSDMLGNQIYTGKVARRNGQFEGFINLSDRASGVYVLRVQHGDKTYSRKLVVQH
ncbi:S8 family peptidase [Pontibacter sp. 172403-2]|uniref:S8 family serine peptidase n=1 Tax=Pontibacter rufus TaxID=2791028 RepID=UPI0018B00FCA|nr:S8 family serine peptidase [Pontibacter sp. 172403-2]MBF9255507.1 S8 family peptidase [Pontibacter sp. 172403-2]